MLAVDTFASQALGLPVDQVNGRLSRQGFVKVRRDVRGLKNVYLYKYRQRHSGVEHFMKSRIQADERRLSDSDERFALLVPPKKHHAATMPRSTDWSEIVQSRKCFRKRSFKQRM